MVRITRRAPDERGEASIEFMVFTIAVIIPIAYFIFTMASLQATSFAVEAAARESARILAHDWQASDFADRQVETIFADYRLRSADEVESVCEPQPCASGSMVTVRISTHVDYPLIPTQWLDSVVPKIPVRATYSMPVGGVEIVP